MNQVNLHTHSKYSLDGCLDINEIINKSFSNGIKYLSITDHDNCDTYLDLDEPKINSQGTLIYGMEADAIINDVTYDILCYGFELDKVRTWAKNYYGTVATRQTKIFNELVATCKKLDIKLDLSITYDFEKEFAHATVFKMLELVEENQKFLDTYNITNFSDFYRLSTMDKEFPLYIDMKAVWPTIETLSEVIHNNGGKLFLAHPNKYVKDFNVDKILDMCSPYIDGIEISNEPNNQEEVEHLYNYAKQKDLLISAGSDFHGTEKHSNLNVSYLNEDMIKDIEDWISKIPGKVNF